MRPISLQKIADILNAGIVGSSDASIEAICTDSRKAAPGCLFVALSGETTDGHVFVDKAAQNGASAAIVKREWAEGRGSLPGLPLVVVEDPLQALGCLGLWARLQVEIPVVGITGSMGKTTTREMLGALLRLRLNTLVSPANFNTEIGVPITLLELNPEHEAAVIELAMRGSGQIAELCSMVLPTAGIITNIGVTHMELLGSRDAIASAKAELLQSLPGQAWSVLPADDGYLDFLKVRAPGPVITFGLSDAADYKARRLLLDSAGCAEFLMRARDEEVPVHLQVPGEYHVLNALAAAAAAGRFGISVTEAAAALSNYTGFDKRSLLKRSPRGWTVYDDTYNASPAAVVGAVKAFAAMEAGGRKIAVIGDMRELGDHLEQACLDVGSALAGAGPDLLVTVGDTSTRTSEAACRFGYNGRRMHFEDSAGAAEYLFSEVREGDLVFVKGARALEMEKIVDRLLQ